MKRSIFIPFLAFLLISSFLPACSPVGKERSTANVQKLATIFPGVITDADYNNIGYLGIKAVQKELKMPTAYSENVAVADVERVMREYIDAHYTIIWTHGGQYLEKTLSFARQFPDVVFIVEGDEKIADLPDNVWLIDRNFHQGSYVMGAIAVRVSQTGKIGYITGLDLPFTKVEVQNIQQAIDDSGKKSELIPVWTGDFNDPAKARKAADQLIGDGVDVIIGSLNLGVQGVFESVKANTTGKVHVIAKYSDKTKFAPHNYITSLIYDFSDPLTKIIGRIQAGEKGGYYLLGLNNGVQIQKPLENVSPEIAAEVDNIQDDLVAGKIQLVYDVTDVQ